MVGEAEQPEMAPVTGVELLAVHDLHTVAPLTGSSRAVGDVGEALFLLTIKL